jgi:hypothetical protein
MGDDPANPASIALSVAGSICRTDDGQNEHGWGQWSQPAPPASFGR